MTFDVSKSHAVRVLALALSVSALSIHLAAAQDAARRVYLDREHGETALNPAMTDLASSAGVTITTGTGPIDAAALVGRGEAEHQADRGPSEDAQGQQARTEGCASRTGRGKLPRVSS